MQIKREYSEPTKVILTIAADQSELSDAKQSVLSKLSKQMKLPGFRPGKAPLQMVERSTDQNALQADVVDALLNKLYSKALVDEKLRPIAQPNVTLKKFVPYSILEFTAEVSVIGEVNLPDYKKIHVTSKKVSVSEKEVDDVIRDLQRRGADKNEVEREAKEGDEVVIDFTGKDKTSGKPISGADGKGYPLLLGSDTFIPGFETNLIGLKPGEQKIFNLTFPSDYGVAALKNRKVSFDVTVTKVNELKEPQADDEFASKAGPFKNMDAMREDIRKQLLSEKQSQAARQQQNELLDKLAAATTVAIPEALIDEEVERELQEVRRNISYRNQTWDDFLAEAGKDEASYRKSLREPASTRLKGSLALTEVADREDIKVTPQELSLQIKLLKGQYGDQAMQAELDKPENARSIYSNMLTEKTIVRLTEYATKKND